MTKAFPSLKQARHQLIDAVLTRGSVLPRFEPMNIHPWLAMSLMQKAIRRGREDLALRASATLLKTSPDRFWRRIGVTTYEDIGVADIQTVAVVTAALKGKRWRSKFGGEWAMANYLVERMARTIKCRAADDLAVVSQWHHTLERSRNEMIHKSISELLDFKLGDTELTEAALALWHAIGTDRCRSPVLPERKGNPLAVWEFLSRSDVPRNVIEIAQEGCRKSNSILCPFLCLLIPMTEHSSSDVIPDNMPEEELIADVPCWAFDVHVREGNQAIARFLRTECETVEWTAQHIPRHERFRVIGSMLFRIESGMVDRRLTWGTGQTLQHMADLETCGVPTLDMREGFRLLRQDLPKLNQERRYIMR